MQPDGHMHLGGGEGGRAAVRAGDLREPAGLPAVLWQVRGHLADAHGQGVHHLARPGAV